MTQVGLMQFGSPSQTRIEFNLGDKKTLKQVNQGVEEMNYLGSLTATGDALRKSGEEVRLHFTSACMKSENYRHKTSHVYQFPFQICFSCIATRNR